MSIEDINCEEGTSGEDNHGYDFYDWLLVYPEDRKTGVTFKGDCEEYLNAHKMIWKLLNRKGAKLVVNVREIRVLDNAKNKPIKLEVKPLRGPTGKTSIKLYDVNKNGTATIMISKVSAGDLVHVKTLAFTIVKYLLDGIIDGVLTDSDLEMMEKDTKVGDEESLDCDVCGKSFKTRNGLNIHKGRMHYNSPQKKSADVVSTVDLTKSTKEVKCNLCQFIFTDNVVMEKHLMICGGKMSTNESDSIDMDCSNNLKRKASLFNCDFCDTEIVAKNNLEGIQKLKKHHEICGYKPKVNDVPTILSCGKCEYKIFDESTFKRHIRDKHDEKTVSTSPKPKRRKKKNFDIVEKMVVDEKDDSLLSRSQMWDKKVLEKRKKLEEEEKKLENKLEREKMEKNKKREIEKGEEMMKKLKLRIKKKSQKNNGLKNQLKPFLEFAWNCQEFDW